MASTDVEPADAFPWPQAEGAIARPPSGLQRQSDRGFLWLCRLLAWGSALVVVYIVGQIGKDALPAMRVRGLSFLVGTTWNPNDGEYGILPEIWGTVYSSVLALLLGSFFGLAVAVFLAEGFLAKFTFGLLSGLRLEHRAAFARLPDQLEKALRNLVELLAAIPSVVYGLWGVFVVIPAIRPLCNGLHERLGWLGVFSTPLSGPGMLPAALVLAIMILPTIAALSRDALSAVPGKLRMAAYGLGATRWETILAVIMPTASRGIFGAIAIAFGRALGETMALAMLVGNANVISLSLFSPANTLAALLANNFPEAGPKDIGLLMYAALVLLAITLAVNMIGALLVLRSGDDRERAR